MNREIKTVLCLVRPIVRERVETKQEKQKEHYDQTSVHRDITVNNAVYILNFARGPKWLPGYVLNKISENMFNILLVEGKTVRRHLDHTKLRFGAVTTEAPWWLDADS